MTQQNTPTTHHAAEQKAAALAALEQMYAYASYEAPKPYAKQAYEELPNAA